MCGRLPHRRWSFRPSRWIYCLLGLMIGAALSRPLPLIPMPADKPMLREQDIRMTPVPEGLATWQVAATGRRAHEYLLVTAEPGPAAVLLPALHRVMAATAPDRSFVLAIIRGRDLPDLPVAGHVHLDYREGDSVEFSLGSAAAGALPLWLRQAALAALAAEAVPVREGLAAEFERLSRSRAHMGPPPAIALQAVGLDPIDLLSLGRAAERLLIALDQLPSLPEPRWWAAGRGSSLYLVAGGRYAPAPVMWVVQLIWLIPMLAGVLSGVRRPTPSEELHLLAEDATLLKAVHDYRLRQGRILSLAGRRRVERRLKSGGGLAHALPGEAAAGLLTAGGLLLAAGAFLGSLTMALAGLLAVPIAWLVKGLAYGKSVPWSERHRALQALLALATVTLTGWTGGHPLSLIALMPALLAWPALAPGRRAHNCLLVGTGTAGSMVLAGMDWPGVLQGPVAPALLVVGCMAVVAFRLALARTDDDDGGKPWYP